MSEVRLALPQRSPMPFSVPWIWRAPARTAASELATACSVSLWAWMPRWSPGMVFATSRDDRLDLLRQRAAVGVAEHHPARAGVVGRLGAGERIGRVRLVAVEEMLAVEEHFPARPRAPPSPTGGCRRGSPPRSSAARRGRDSPRSWRRSRWRRPWRRGARGGPDRWTG